MNDPPAAHPRSRRAARLALGAGLCAACYAAGYALGRAVPPRATADYEIRAGRSGLTNPLLECEIAGYRRSRELRPFNDRIGALVDSLVRRGAADRVSVYFRDLDNGPWFGIREEEAFTPASLLKVPTVIAALAQAERDPAFLTRTVLFRGFTDGASAGGYVPPDPLVPGRSYTIEELVRRTAANSDNAALALLGLQVEPSALARVFRDLDLPIDPSRRDGRAGLSPRAYGLLFRVLYNASYLRRPMSERALGHFAESTFAVGLAGGLPPGTLVAHKFGIYSMPWQKSAGQLHDCGIVYFEPRPYFLCVMTEGRDVDQLAGVIREISRGVYGEVAAQTGLALPGQPGRPPFGP